MNQRGFTIPELLASIVLLAALGAGSYYLLHPYDYQVESHNAARRTGVAYIVQAVNRYHAATGQLPTGITAKPTMIGSTNDHIDLCNVLVPAYASDIPLDPTHGIQSEDERCNSDELEYLAGYTIQRNTDGTSITVAAPNAEGGTKISITHHYR